MRNQVLRSSLIFVTAAACSGTSVTIPDSDFTTRIILDDRELARKDPFIVPGTSKGSTMTVHVEASDGRGLASNVVDFAIALN